jgi:predicted ATPase
MAIFSYHLGPNRTYQARLYSKGSSDSEINEILTHYVLSKVRATDPAVKFLNKWLKEFELGDELVTELYEGVATKVTIIKNGRHINIVNIGFGSGQLLTILLKITSIIADQTRTATTKRMASPTVLIEEPEANLHPRLQSRLADMFLDASKTFQLRFVLETHSEYMIRRLQLLVAYKQCALSDAVIYYLDKSAVKKLEFLPDGKLSDSFGEGFFDEADAEAMELYRIQKRKILNK